MADLKHTLFHINRLREEIAHLEAVCLQARDWGHFPGGSSARLWEDLDSVELGISRARKELAHYERMLVAGSSLPPLCFTW